MPVTGLRKEGGRSVEEEARRKDRVRIERQIEEGMKIRKIDDKRRRRMKSAE